MLHERARWREGKRARLRKMEGESSGGGRELTRNDKKEGERLGGRDYAKWEDRERQVT